jgi:hypothetical protein
MMVKEITEGFTTAFAKQGNKSVRKYRCTSGSRKGRVVAKPSTCSAPKNMTASRTLRKTKAAKGSTIKTKTRRTKKTNPGSIRTAKINRSRKRSRSTRKRKKI